MTTATENPTATATATATRKDLPIEAQLALEDTGNALKELAQARKNLFDAEGWAPYARLTEEREAKANAAADATAQLLKAALREAWVAGGCKGSIEVATRMVDAALESITKA